MVQALTKGAPPIISMLRLHETMLKRSVQWRNGGLRGRHPLHGFSIYTSSSSKTPTSNISVIGPTPASFLAARSRYIHHGFADSPVMALFRHPLRGFKMGCSRASLAAQCSHRVDPRSSPCGYVASQRRHCHQQQRRKQNRQRIRRCQAEEQARDESYTGHGSH